MRSFAMLLCVLLAGCAGSLGNLSEIGESAPEWYEARKTELRGKDYPQLSNVPLNATYERRSAGLVKSAEEREAIRDAFFSNERSAPAYLTPAQINAWGEEMHERFSVMDVLPDFLTEDEISSLRARFERPRARR